MMERGAMHILFTTTERFAFRGRAWIIYLIVLLSFGFSAAQPPGELSDMQIDIINPLKITLPRADRNFGKVPAQPVQPIVPPLEYGYTLVPFSTMPFTPPVRPLRIKTPEQEMPAAGFVSAGFGNYTSPYLNAFLPFFPSKSKVLGGLSLNHHSFAKGNIDGKNSSNGTSAAAVNLKFANKKAATELMAGFENRTAKFYGYGDLDWDADTLKQAWSTFFASARVSNSSKGNIEYEFRPAFSTTKNKFKANESDFSVVFNATFKMKGQNAVLLQSGYSWLSRNDTAFNGITRHFFRATPQYQFFPIDKLNVRVGLTVAYENDSIGKANFHIYPAIQATYPVSNKFGVYVGITGDMEKVSLHTLSASNIWIRPSLDIFHTNKVLDIAGGIQGNAGSGFSLAAGFSFARLNHYYMFANNQADLTKFETWYDDVTRTNVNAAINFDRGNYSFRIRGDYFAYAPDKGEEVWHLPTFKFDVLTVIKAGEKLSFIPRMVVQGGMKAYHAAAENPVIELPTAADLSLSADYNVNKKIGLFVRFNNMLASDYSLYYRYPVRGFQGMAGFTWRF